MNHGLDTDARVCFYEQEFYPLSNFSAFALFWRGLRFDTSEAAYHWEKFPDDNETRSALRQMIHVAPSAHEAFRIAQNNAPLRRSDWNAIKVDVMRKILRAKASQHAYVHKKLLETGDRELVENSWRDDFWGWGPRRDGKNMLGLLWMEIRAEIRGPHFVHPGTPIPVITTQPLIDSDPVPSSPVHQHEGTKET